MCDLGLLCCLLAVDGFSAVTFEEKVEEEDEEGENVPQIHSSDTRRESLAANAEEVDRLGVHGEELDDLEEGQVFLPPDVLGVHGEEVVGVHDRVDGTVEDHSQVDVTVVAGVEVEPVDEEDGHVVVDVEERELGGFLAEDDEEGVEEVEDLGDVEEPEEVAHHGVGGVVRLAGEEGVVL